MGIGLTRDSTGRMFLECFKNVERTDCGKKEFSFFSSSSFNKTRSRKFVSILDRGTKRTTVYRRRKV